jgi:nitrite reductase/ring-hydroxylating ferredoxin subunit
MADDLQSEKMPRWREDFPIRWENDHYVTRRDLVKFLTLGSGLLVLANVGIAIAGKLWRTPQFPAMRIAGAESLASMSSLLFRYPTEDDPCILVRTASGELRAFSQICTHLSCTVLYEHDRNNLLCPCHLGRFEVNEGRPTAGPPVRPLPRILLENRAGAVYAVGVEV